MSRLNRARTPLPLKNIFLLAGCAFLISCCMMIATVPIHESCHWIMSEIDPDLTVVAFYPFGVPEDHQAGYALTSILGAVIVQEAYPGAFQHRPEWADLLQEVICILVQLIITCYVTIKLLGKLMIKPLLQPPTHHKQDLTIN